MFNKTADQLIAFSKRIADIFETGELTHMMHLSGGNEDIIIDIFKDINVGDYIFSTHRSHYHYLLAGGSEDKLEDIIRRGESMYVFDKKLNFLTSSIVAGTPAIAVGVAMALKMKNSKQRVWCFVGDGAEDEGHLYEAVRYAYGFGLPCTFVIEDNDRSVDANKDIRYGGYVIEWPDNVKIYSYTPTWPHGGTGTKTIVKFNGVSNG